jgi:hypothetical protein
MPLVYHNAFGKTLYITRTQYRFDTDPTYPPPPNMHSQAPSICEHATTEWLKELGVTADEKISTEAQTTAAREAFNVVTTNVADAEQKAKLLQLKTPEAVRHITGMLTAYDWEFVEMAKELRGYTVAKLFEETQSPNANIRLKALGLLGKVTEVGLFTDKIEVKKTDLTDEEIDRKLKDKLAKFMGVQDADVIEDIEINETERPDTESN